MCCSSQSYFLSQEQTVFGGEGINNSICTFETHVTANDMYQRKGLQVCFNIKGIYGEFCNVFQNCSQQTGCGKMGYVANYI